MFDILRDIWRNPGGAFSPMPFWFWNDKLDKDELLRQLSDFHKKGVDGFVIHPRMGLDGGEYLSDEFFEFVTFVADEAKKRHMSVILYDEGMYPSGSAHGRVVAEDSRFAARRLYALPMDEMVPAGDEILYRLYLKFDNGMLADASVGEADGYTGYNFILGYTNGTIRGLKHDEDDRQSNAPLAADLLNVEAVASFIRNTHEEYYKRMKEHFGSTIIGFFTDEPSLPGRRADMRGGISWSYDTIGYFFEAGGEIEQLAHLLFEAKEKKLRREAEFVYNIAIRKNLSASFYAQLADWCKDHGIALMGHPEKSNDCDYLKYFHIPGQDLVWRSIEPGTELTAPDSVMAKLTSDCARHRGCSRNSNECFGVCGEKGNPWNFTPDDMMWYLNYLFARGCNMIIPHAFYYSVRTPLQFDERPPDVGPNNIWWKDYRSIAMYIKRMSWLNSMGSDNPVAAVLCSSDYVPCAPVKPLYEKGYNFHYLTLDDLMEKAHIHDGKVCIDRYKYDLVLVDGRLRLNTAIVRKLGRMVTEGGYMYHGSDFIGCVEKRVKRTSYFDGETGGKLRFVQHTKSGCTFFLMVNEGTDEIAGNLITDIACAAERFDAFSGKTFPLSGELADGGFAYRVIIPAHSAVVIGMDPSALPVIGKTDVKQKLCEINSLSDGRMSFEYHTSENRTVKLTFTAIHDIADVYVNGESAGRLLFMPYELDITKYLVDGENTVEVSVTGSMANTYGNPVPVGFEGCTVRVFESIK